MDTFIIYKITCKCGLNYIGSTTNFYRRMIEHKSKCFNQNSDQYNCFKYQHIRSCCEWNDLRIVDIFKFEGDNLIRQKVEKYFIEKFDTVNNGLNSMSTYGGLNIDDYHKKWRDSDISIYHCLCGKNIMNRGRWSHFKTKHHIKFLAQASQSD